MTTRSEGERVIASQDWNGNIVVRSSEEESLRLSGVKHLAQDGKRLTYY